MKTTCLALFLVLVLCTAACDWLNDMTDQILGDDDDDDGDHKRPYREHAAIALGDRTATLDPYDGSLDLIDPLGPGRVSIPTSPDAKRATLLADGVTVAVFDTKNDQALFVDTQARDVAFALDTGETTNRLIPAPAGPYVLAIYDPNYGDADFGDSGIVNYYEIDILDTQTQTTRSVSVDFSPDRVIFSADGGRCLLGKTSRLIDLDLATGETVTYPLTLGIENPREARQVIVSPDGAFAVALVNQVRDVYVIDLIAHSINIIDPGARASSIAFVPDTRVLMLTVQDLASLAVVDLDAPIAAWIDLGAPYNTLLPTPDWSRVTLYAGNGVSTLGVLNTQDIVTIARNSAGEWVEPDSAAYTIFQLTGTVNNNTIRNPVIIDSGSQYLATVVHGFEGLPHAVNLLDLSATDAAGRVATPLGLEGEASGFAFSTNTPSLGLVLPSAQKFVVVNAQTLVASARPIGPRARRVHYLAEAGTFVVDYNHTRGKLAFVGDVNPDFFWFAMRIFDR